MADRFRANILSLEPSLLAKLQGLSERVPVFHTGVGRVVGTAFEYKADGEDLWAILTVEDKVPRAARCVGILVFNSAGPRLVAVLYTDLSREMAASLGDVMRSGPKN